MADPPYWFNKIPPKPRRWVALAMVHATLTVAVFTALFVWDFGTREHDMWLGDGVHHSDAYLMTERFGHLLSYPLFYLLSFLPLERFSLPYWIPAGLVPVFLVLLNSAVVTAIGFLIWSGCRKLVAAILSSQKAKS
jgi:hypothetical protein